MATIRSYTTVEQSRKLAKILLLESADMYYWCADHYPKEDWIIEVGTPDDNYECIYAWSLSALLNVLPDKSQIVLAINDFQGDGKKKYAIGSVEHDKYDCYADNPIDACIAMIEKLHELKML